MDNSLIKIVYKKPTEYDNLSDNISGSISQAAFFDNQQIDITKNKINIQPNLEEETHNISRASDMDWIPNTNPDLKNKINQKQNYLEKFDNIITNTDINDGLFLGILFLTFIIIIMAFFKRF